MLSSIREEQARWGTVATVAVITEQREVGELVDTEHVEFISLPVAALPDDAIRSDGQLVSEAVVPLLVGDVLRARDVAGDSPRIAEGQRVVALANGADVPDLAVGDAIDVFVFHDAFGLVEETESDVVAGTVVQLSNEAVAVAVEERHAQRIAAGIVNGTVIVAAR